MLLTLSPCVLVESAQCFVCCGANGVAAAIAGLCLCSQRTRQWRKHQAKQGPGLLTNRRNLAGAFFFWMVGVWVGRLPNWLGRGWIVLLQRHCAGLEIPGAQGFAFACALLFVLPLSESAPTVSILPLSFCPGKLGELALGS